MTMTDPIADMFTRLRNGGNASKDVVTVPKNTYICAVLNVLKESSYIGGYSTRAKKKGFGEELLVELKYQANGKSVMQGSEKISTPGRRQYYGASEIPRVRNGFGVMIMSTSQGVMTDAQARKRGIGGEAVGKVW